MAKGMSKLLESKPNAANSMKTTQSVSYQGVLKESKDDALKVTKQAKAEDANEATITPLILDMELARAEADQHNIHSQTIVGTKEGIVQALQCIVGKHIIDKIAKTSNGSNNVSIDNYSMHNIIQCTMEHATRPKIDSVLALMMGFYDTMFDFRNTINQNITERRCNANQTVWNQHQRARADSRSCLQHQQSFKDKVGHGIPTHNVSNQKDIHVQLCPQCHLAGKHPC